MLEPLVAKRKVFTKKILAAELNKTRATGRIGYHLRMRPFLTLLCLVTVSLAFASDEPVEELQKLVEANKVKSVTQLISLLPKEMRERWQPVFDSSSLQGGTRIVMRSADNALTLSFNLDPAVGFNTVEVKGRSKKAGRFIFAEINFEQDEEKMPSSLRDKERPEYVDGRAFHSDVVKKDLHGRLVSCSNCHAMGRTRFDLREELPRVKTTEPKDQKALAETFLQQLRDGSNARLKALTASAELTQIAKDNDLAALERNLTAQVHRTHDELAVVNAQVVADRLQSELQKSPRLAAIMLGVFKDCPLTSLLTAEEWNRHLAGMYGLDPEQVKRFSWMGKQKEETALTEFLTERVRKKQADKSIRSIRLDDPSADPRLLARLTFVWDPIDKAANGDSNDPSDHTRVSYWSMTPHFVGYYFGGQFPLYQREISARLAKQVETAGKLPAAQQTCDGLATLIHKLGEAEARAAAETSHAQPR